MAERLRRRAVLAAGVGAAAVAGALPHQRAGAQPAEGPFPAMPGADTTSNQDRLQMLWQLGIERPRLPTRALDPNRPLNIRPSDPANPEGNWTDPLGHFVTRADFGQWITYDDSAGLAGGSASAHGDYGPGSSPRYPDIPLLSMRDGTAVGTPEEWWTKRRPEILRDVRNLLYGNVPDPARWPGITWSAGPVTTGTANGIAYQQRVVTGSIDIGGYPQVRNTPRIEATLRTPLELAGQPVPVVLTFGSAAGIWQFTGPHGYGACGFNPGVLQPDSGGANLSSYLIGLVNQGNWRRPGDWGTLAAWGWGISRLIDFFESYPDVDSTRIALQGHSRFGKATLVAAAYEERIGAAFPTSAGAMGTSFIRRAWGETLELVAGADSEYHWVAGNIMGFQGELNPGTYWPRRVANLPVDVHCTVALVAPRLIMINGGTDVPPGFGDAWTDPRGMYLAAALGSPAWELLGWPGLQVPPNTTFTSGPGESIGGTPPIDVAFVDGTVGYRRHREGHTPIPDWPYFMQLVTRHFNATRPTVTAGLRFLLGEGPSNVVGTATATGGAGDVLGNWQITGGNGVGAFAIDPVTGTVTIRDGLALDLARVTRYQIEIVVDNRKLTSARESLTVAVPERVNVIHRGRTLTVHRSSVRDHLLHGDSIGRS